MPLDPVRTPKTQRPSIGDLSVSGCELSDEDLRLAAGGRLVSTGPAAKPTYRDGHIVDGCIGPRDF